MAVFVGSIKSFNPTKGWGFIECAETHGMYGKDIFVLKNALGGIEVNRGDQVQFEVTEGKNGPQAAYVDVMSRTSLAPPRTAGSGVIGKPMSGGLVGQGRPMPMKTTMMQPVQTAAATAFVGVVKSWSEEKGYGFVTSDVCLQLYGKDIFFRAPSVIGGPVGPGQQVSFAVVNTEKGPQAQNVQPFHSVFQQPMQQARLPASRVPTAQQPLMVRGNGHAISRPMMMQAAPGVRRLPKENERFFGSVKSYSEEKGWGHIDCPQTKELYNKDIFLLQSEVADRSIMKGTLVSFKVKQGIKGPQAIDLMVLPPGSIGSNTQPGNMFGASVKSYNADKGYGFATSEEILQIFGKDIFFSQRELQGKVPMAGDTIHFAVEKNATGQPEAKNITVGGDGEGDFGPVRNGRIAAMADGRSSPY